MSGIAILKKLLMKQAVKGSGQASGIMSIGDSVRKIADKKLQSYIMSAKKQGVDIDKLSEQEIKYILSLNKPKPVKAISADSPEGKLFTQGMMDMLEKASGKNVIQTDFGKPFAEEVGSVDGTIKYLKTLEPMDSMKEANKVLKGEGRYKRLSEVDRKKIVNDESVTDHIFERNIEPDPEDFAQGGRTGTGLNYLLGEDDQNVRMPFGLGGMSKRLFLKLMGGAAAGTVAAKSGLLSLLKGGGKKQIAKEVLQVPIENIKGMPDWFKPLVSKIIKTGGEVESGAERVIVHKSKLPNSKTDLYVTQELDTGNVMVDIGQGKHGFTEGHLGQPVRLEYKAAEDIMSGPDMDDMHKIGERDPLLRVKSSVHEDLVGSGLKGDPKSLHLKPGKTSAEFWVDEAEFTGGHPENIKFEDTVSEKFGSHGSNFDEVEKFATGKIKKKTAKESLKAERSHWTPDDMASGGRVPLAGGNIVPGPSASIIPEDWDDMDPDELRHIIKLLRAGEIGAAEGGRVPLGVGGLAGMLGE